MTLETKHPRMPLDGIRSERYANPAISIDPREDYPYLSKYESVLPPLLLVRTVCAPPMGPGHRLAAHD